MSYKDLKNPLRMLIGTDKSVEFHLYPYEIPQLPSLSLLEVLKLLLAQLPLKKDIAVFLIVNV